MALRAGVWAVMFTDMVASTEHRARAGDRAGDLLKREHDAIVEDVLGTYRGESVTDTGDGAMCVFASGVDAIDAAVAIQCAAADRNGPGVEPLKLRVGVSLGELAFENGTLLGMPAHEAARVCAQADLGEILISDVLRIVIGSRAGVELVARGEFDLKGIPDPVVLWEVPWQPTGTGPRLPIPPLLLPPDSLPFTGRDQELARLVSAWKDAAAGSCRIVLLVGEPGIGKTRLAAEAASLAHSDGALVLYGRCDGELRIPYQPFVEALDWYVDHAIDPVLGARPGPLAVLTPRVMPAPERVGLASTLPETEMHRLFEAVADWLSDLGAEQPAVVVLDDIHWASPPTLLLLRHIARRSEEVPLLIMATYRDTDLDRGDALDAVLPDLIRLAKVERIELGGLDEAGVSELLSRAGIGGEGAPSSPLTGALMHETDGNPFFIGEVVRDLVESGAVAEAGSADSLEDLGVPLGVREVVRQRLARLGGDAGRVLQAAAIAGRDFDLDVVGVVAGLPPLETAAVLEEARAAQLIDEISVDRYRFRHALVQAALADEISASRRVRLHRAIAQSLEVAGDEDLAGLAHHWYQVALNRGAPSDKAGRADVETAIGYARRQGDRAFLQHAPEDAARSYGNALDLIDHLDRDEAQSQRLQLLEALGGAQAAIGDRLAYRATFRDMAELASALGIRDLYVRAVLGYVGRSETAIDLDDFARTGIVNALDSLDEHDRAVRIRLLGALASGITNREPERAIELSLDALGQARVLDDPVVLFDSMRDRIRCWWDPTALDERLDLVTEMEALASRLDDDDAIAQAAQWRSILSLEAGDLIGLETAIDTIEKANAGLGLRYYRWAGAARRAALELSRGGLDEAERLMFEAETHRSHDFSVFQMQYLTLSWLRGRLGELENALLAFDDDNLIPPTKISVRAVWALLCAEEGRLDEAAIHLTALTEALDDVARHQLVLTLVGMVAGTAAAMTGPGPWVDALRSLLDPLEGGFAVFNPSVSSLGSIDSVLGRLADLAGDHERAVTLARHAVEANRQAGLRPFVVLALNDLAYLLSADDPPASRRAAAEADALAAEIGMPTPGRDEPDESG